MRISRLVLALCLLAGAAQGSPGSGAPSTSAFPDANRPTPAAPGAAPRAPSAAETSPAPAEPPVAPDADAATDDSDKDANEPTPPPAPAAPAKSKDWNYLASEPPEDERPKKAPLLFGVGVEVGAAFGGDTLLTALYTDGSSQDMNAGQGAVLALRGFVTPFWIGNTLGLGLSLDFGWKYTSITAQNVTVELTRLPLDLQARAMLRASEGAYLFLGGGLHHESSITLSASGAFQGNGNFDNALGGTVEAGVLFALGHLGIDATGRYSALTYTLGSASADASHGGIFTSLLYIM